MEEFIRQALIGTPCIAIRLLLMSMTIITIGRARWCYPPSVMGRVYLAELISFNEHVAIG